MILNKIIDKIKNSFFLDTNKLPNATLKNLSHHHISYKTVNLKNKTIFLADFRSSSLLRKLGFQTATNWVYINNGNEPQLKYFKGYKNNEDDIISAPTKNQVTKFINNKDKINLAVYSSW